MKDTVGGRIRARREMLGWSQGVLADKIGTGRSLIGRYERDLVSPSVHQLQAIAKALHIQAQSLVPGMALVDNEPDPPAHEFAHVPLAIGLPKRAWSEVLVGTNVYIPRGVMDEQKLNTPVVVRSVGTDEMVPHILPGDSLLVDIGRDKPRWGELVAVRYDEKVMLRWFIRSKRANWLEASNPKNKPIKLVMREMELLGRSDYLAAGFGEVETAEFDRDDTIDAIEGALIGLGYATDRIGSARDLAARLCAGDRWDLVFNIAEGLNGIGREAQVPALLDIFGIPYTFSDPLVMSLTLHKGMTKRVVRDAGIRTADFQIVKDRDDAQKITFPPPYFIKPVAEGTGKGISPQSIIRRSEDLSVNCEALAAAYNQAVLVERFLPGREFTVGILGTGPQARVLGTIEVHLLAGAEAEIYSYTNKERCEELVEYRLVSPRNDPVVSAAEDVAQRAWRVLECRDAGRIDLRCDTDGQPHFMEVNPLAGLHPHHSDLPIICSHVGMPFEGLIREIIDSARKRVCASDHGNGANQ